MSLFYRMILSKKVATFWDHAPMDAGAMAGGNAGRSSRKVV
jgi:hypothetical protein